ncbi:uncharacterized protein LOC116063675 [Sander lucioperca]|uniref:uncharacterized protein LOC116063675 n=1 Tax=Sander lucioperca TaxID=283035 RepID=UPI001653B32C|nr:uncharacterized protein LOC116063675 [Sander lucioperca]
MRWKTIICIGVIVFIVFNVFNFVLVIMAATTVSKAEQRERREGHENVQLICRESLDAAVGDNVTLDFHLEPGSDATKWTAFVFECKYNSSNVLVYKSRDFSKEDQANRFRGRVSPDSSWELREGKLAWKISQFQESDAGTYRCIVRNRTHQLPCSTELKIKQFHPHELNTSDGYHRHDTSSSIPEKPTDGNNTGSTNTLSGGAITGIVTAGIISIIIIAGVICK